MTIQNAKLLERGICIVYRFNREGIRRGVKESFPSQVRGELGRAGPDKSGNYGLKNETV